MAIDGEDGIYREMTHGFIVQPDPTDGSITAISIDDNGTRRELREDERKIALSLGINVINPVPLPNPVSSIPQVPQVAVPPS